MYTRTFVFVCARARERRGGREREGGRREGRHGWHKDEAKCVDRKRRWT